MSLVLFLFLVVGGAAAFSSLAQSIIEPTSWVRYVDMSANGEIMAFRDDSTTFIYSNNGAQFVKKSEWPAENNQDALDVTADGEWILDVNR